MCSTLPAGCDIKGPTRAANQIRDLTVTAPDRLRSRLRDLNTDDWVALCAPLPDQRGGRPRRATKAALRTLAGRIRS